MRLHFAAAAAVLVLAAALPARADEPGVPVVNGNPVQGEITPAGDEDCFAIPLVEGGTLSVKLGPPRGGVLLSSLRILDPSGDEVPPGSFLKVSATGKSTLKNFPIGQTGVWSVCVRGETSSTGTYLISFASKAPKKFTYRAVTVPGANSSFFEAPGIDGAGLTFTVKEKSGPPVTSAVLRNPADQTVTGPPGVVARKGKTISGKGFILDDGFGVYGVLVQGSGAADTVVDCTIGVKFPKPDKVLRVLGAEPRPTSMSPSTGTDGTPIIVGGSGFAPGAILLFGGIPGVDVVFDSATQIRGKAPGGVASTNGNAVQILVVNPDGQCNPVPGMFQYIGPPKVTTVAPAFTPLEGGLTHTVTGSGFRPGFTLTLGGQTPSTVQLVSGNQITFVGDPKAEGSYALVIADEFDRSTTVNSAVTYIGPPTVVSVSPSSASFTGGRKIRLTGTRIHPGLQVFVDGDGAAGVTAISGTQLDFLLPAGPAGTFDVTIRDEFGRDATLPASLSRRGPFEQTSSTAVPAAPTGADFFGASLALGDVDGDGAADDILVSSIYPGYDSATSSYFPGTWVLVNDGSATFTDATAGSLPGLESPRDFGQAAVILLGDLDGQTGDEAILSLYYPLGFQNRVFNRGGTDYAYYVYTTYGNYADYQTYRATRVLANDGSGAFTDATASAVPDSGSSPFFGRGERFQAAAGAMGDLDGDSKADMFLAASNSIVNGIASYGYANAGVTYLKEDLAQASLYIPAGRILIGNGSGGFTAGASLPGPYYYTRFNGGTPYYGIAEDFSGDAVALGDLDGDLDTDVVVCRSYPRYIYYLNPVNQYAYYYYADATRVLTNDGTGTLAWDPTRVPVSYGVTNPGTYDYWQADSVALGDLDADGDKDIVLGKAAAFYTYDPATMGYRLVPAIRIFENDGTGRFADNTGSFLAASSFRTGSKDTILGARALQVGDLDGDTVADLVVAGGVYYVYDAGNGFGYYGLVPSGPILSSKIFINDGTGNLIDRTAQWMPAPVNGDRFQAADVALGDLDGDGDVDLVLADDYYPYTPGETTGQNRPLRVFLNK